MQITLTIPEEQRNRVINALATYYNYPAKVPDPNTIGVVVNYIDNPQTKAQFVKQQLIEHIKNVVKQVELEEARRNLTVENVDVS